MAGMLPGVEAARRRRFHQGGGGGSPPVSSGGPGFTRRPVFCLYATGNDTQLISSFSSSKKIYGGGDCGGTTTTQDVKLGQLAREAKERLDERLLRTQRKLQIRRNNSDITEERSSVLNNNRNGGGGDSTIMIRELQTEVFGSTTRKKKNNNNNNRVKRTWEKLGVGRWKSSGGEESDQPQEEECSICLDSFSVGENLVNLICAHKFHSRCLLPWLQTNSQSHHCPCCRTLIFSSS